MSLLTPLPKFFARLALVLAAVLVTAPGPVLAADEPTVLITGANRGIGLEFVRQYAAKGYRVIATARNVADAKELQDLAKGKPNIIVEKLDVTDHAGVDAVAAKYKDQPIDILLNTQLTVVQDDGGVRAFDDIYECTLSYVHNLNTHRAYDGFRRMRANMLAATGQLDGHALAGALTRYSGRGHLYVEALRSIIRANDLAALDRARLSGRGEMRTAQTS